VRGVAMKYYTEEGNWDLGGTPSSFRLMNSYGSHAYSLWNQKDENFWVKFYFKTVAEAAALIAKTRESHGEDLYNAIDRGEFPRWYLQVQIMPELFPFVNLRGDAAPVLKYHQIRLSSCGRW
jgi:catalase